MPHKFARFVLACLAMACSSNVSGDVAHDQASTQANRSAKAAVVSSQGDTSVWDKLCVANGATSGCDLCQVLGWYGDGQCDTFCPQADPDCPAASESPYTGAAAAIPGTIEAEDYDLGGEGIAYHDSDNVNTLGADRNDGVDIKSCTDSVGCGFAVGTFGAGEWLHYTVNVTADGAYDFSARVATVAAMTFHVTLDGNDISGPIAVAANESAWDGGWSTVTKPAVSLTDGTHVLGIANDNGYFDLNDFAFARAGSASAPSTLIEGVYCGNDPQAILDYESWLGKHTGGILGYTGDASWSDYDGSVGWAIALWSAIDRPVLWSVPLIPTGATLADAASGAYNDHYRAAAEQLAQFRPNDPVLYIRTGWELNGNWFPWAAAGQEADFVSAFRNFVQTYRSVSSRFVFEWNVNVDTQNLPSVEASYPGDDVVDLIGMDVYYDTTWDPADATQAFNTHRDSDVGLAWHQAFAAQHGKPTTYSEWGVNSDGAGPYIDLMLQWITSHPVVYATYWNSNAAFSGQMSNDQYPTAAAEYLKDFGP